MLNINIIQDENRELVGPPIRLTEDKIYRLAVMSFRCTLGVTLPSNQIFYLRCNIIVENDTNPKQIICFISGRRGNNFLSYNPPQNISYKLSTHQFLHEHFTLHSLEDHSEVQLVTAALQLHIRGQI